MRNPAEREIKKDVILRKCFECLTEKGIEATTIKDFSDATGMSMSSIYYWFEDKDEIVLDAVEWGLDENVKILFNFAFKNTDNLTKLCEGIKELAREYKKQFRLIFQVATSPQYGEKVRRFSSKLDFEYKRYTDILSEKLAISFDFLYPFINLFVSSFVDCVMWDRWDKFDMEMKSIITIIEKKSCEFIGAE